MVLLFQLRLLRRKEEEEATRKKEEGDEVIVQYVGKREKKKFEIRINMPSVFIFFYSGNPVFYLHNREFVNPLHPVWKVVLRKWYKTIFLAPSFFFLPSSSSSLHHVFCLPLDGGGDWPCRRRHLQGLGVHGYLEHGLPAAAARSAAATSRRRAAAARGDLGK